MAFSFRYNLRDMLGLLTLVPLSTGLVILADLASGAALSGVRSSLGAIEDAVASTVGRGYFIYGFNGVASGLMLACLVVPLLLLRNHLATLAAFSLPFSMLFFMFPLSWATAVPLTSATALGLVQPAIVATVVGSRLFAFCVCCRRRLQAAGGRVEVACVARRPSQRVVLTLAFVAYLLLGAYGWYEIASFRAGVIAGREYWEQIVP